MAQIRIAVPRGVFQVVFKAAVLVAVLLASFPAIAGNVQVDAAEGVEFSDYETFTWKALERPPGSMLESGAPLDRHIRQAVDEELGKKGLRPARGDAPDLVVSYEAVIVPGQEKETVHKDLGPITWVGVGNENPLDLGAGYEGLLAITFTEVESGKEVWTGRATKIALSSDPEKLKKKASKAVKAILKKLKR